jgi:uncharacterized Tic20 family protein
MDPPGPAGPPPAGNRPDPREEEDEPLEATVAEEEEERLDRRPVRVSADDRTMAMFCHLSGTVSGFIGPLIIWLIKKDESRFVDHHGRTAVNFGITLVIAAAVSWIGGVVLGVLTCGLGFLIILPLVFGGAVFGLVFWIIAAVKANNGEWYRYPVAIPFIGRPNAGRRE